MDTASNANPRVNNRESVSARKLRDYSRGHQDRTNLLLHVLTVPLFWAGNIALVAGAATRSPAAALIGLAMTLSALVAQGRGHRREHVPPRPFHGPIDFVARFMTEQWLTFPRYVATGAFARAWREAGGSAGARTV